ncbi:sigma-70 family RNA polymerase sigma factor [Streptomyces sp. 4F14]|uniref:sigma-70 family RNA polymerase sigma factor n=1 Tax=Streptomyces sp. 4F14 TaxID=3394380 RepID=UPI003A87A8D6
MSVDGRDESQGGDTGELDAPQVPPQRDRRDESVLPPLRELPPADADLIASMRAGDDTAYEELYRRHADAVRRYARTCCRDGHTADDLTAEVFARMLQAVRGGSGPEYAVRAYLLTSVRRVAAQWIQSAKREQLVDDFAVFAAQAAGRASEVGDDDTLELGADVRAMHEAEQSMAMQAFRSLPERWQAVLWHTEVEDESPSEVATLFGLDANGTRVLASRAREGLKQAYLQAHVSATLTSDEECSRYADQLGTYARKRLRTRAERGLRKHLEECAKCRLAALQIEEVASGIPAVVPVAVIGWFGAAGYAKAAALIAGGVGAGAAGVGGAAAAANGGSGAAASEGLGAPVKAGIAAGVVAVAAAAVALALVGNDEPAKTPAAPPPSSAPVVRQEVPASPSPSPSPSREAPEPVAVAPVPSASASVKPSPPAPQPAPVVPRPTPSSPAPSPTPSAKPSPTPTPTPPRPPAVYPLNELAYNANGDGTNPEIRLFESSWVWQRDNLSIAGRSYSGVTVRAGSSVTIDLNRTCTSYDALVGVDDTTLRLGQAYFAVYADGVRLWRSGLVKGGDPAVPVHVDLTGRKTVRLVVEPYTPFDELALVDWAESKFRCG